MQIYNITQLRRIEVNFVSSQMPGRTGQRGESSFDTTPWDLMTVLMHQGMIKYFLPILLNMFYSVSA